MAIVTTYLQDFQKYINLYGDKTVCLIQIGGFYEIYSRDEPTLDTYKIIYDISNICDLSIVPKNYNNEHNSKLLGSGFGVHVIDKYTKKINDAGYTCIIISQDSNNKNTTRSVSDILTPGTYIDDNINFCQTNNITSLWIENIKNNLYVGISNINVISGDSHIFQYETPYSHLPNIYDTIEKYITIYNPKETIIIYNLSSSVIDNMIQYVNIKSLIRKINLNDKNNINTQNALKCEKQKYQQSIYKNYFEINDEHSFMQQFIYNDFSSQSFCFLIDFLVKLNPFLVKKISLPKIDNLTDRLVLANHSLLQLNITSNNSSKLSCVLSLTDNTLTPIGKRNFSNILLNPITDIDLLNKYYDLTEKLIDDEETFTFLRNHLRDIKDLDKIYKLILIKKLPPKSLYVLFFNLENISLLYKKISSQNYSLISSSQPIDIFCESIKKHIERIISIDKIKNIYNIEENIFLQNVFPELDTMEQNYQESIDKLSTIVQYFNSIITDNQKPKKVTLYTKLHPTEKSGFTLPITKTRAKILEQLIANSDKKTLDFISSYSHTKSSFIFDLSSIKIVTVNSNTVITSPQIESINNQYIKNKSSIKDYTQEKYQEFLSNLDKFINSFYSISDFVGEIDVLQNRAYIANHYNYCKPTIVNSDNSFFQATQLRHCIIEQLQNNELYVPNDVSIGNDNPNMLIFGTNAVGKTSLIKACGCAIILAQAGLYVPASSFYFYPYKQIFTRILNHDNMFKGLSTFTLEMSEMSNILKYSDKHSLILGDELCSGTEIRSALCIFISGITDLHNKNSSFIFATHFHELLDFEEIKNLKKLAMKHMQVSYDSESGELIYDRLLKDGSGESIYGLEVCKSLHLPDEFLNYAFEILNKYYPQYKTPLDYQPTRYNSSKIKGMCELCNTQIGTDVHHLQFQQNANNKGFINNFHKNHIANLVNICETCHDKIHKNNTQLVKKKTTKGTKIVECSN